MVVGAHPPVIALLDRIGPRSNGPPDGVVVGKLVNASPDFVLPAAVPPWEWTTAPTLTPRGIELTTTPRRGSRLAVSDLSGFCFVPELPVTSSVTGCRTVPLSRPLFDGREVGDEQGRLVTP